MQQSCKSCRTCFMFYCMFYFTCDRSFIGWTCESCSQTLLPLLIIIIIISLVRQIDKTRPYNGNNKKAQLPQGLRATAMRLWRALANKSKLSRKPYPRTKHHVDRQTGCEVMVIFGHPRWPSVAILDFWNSKVAPLDRPTTKTLP